MSHTVTIITAYGCDVCGTRRRVRSVTTHFQVSVADITPLPRGWYRVPRGGPVGCPACAPALREYIAAQEAHEEARDAYSEKLLAAVECALVAWDGANPAPLPPGRKP